MNVLLVGSGGREHALAWKMTQSKLLKNLCIAPGNGGTGQVGTNVNISETDSKALLKFAQKNEIDLVVVGRLDLQQDVGGSQHGLCVGLDPGAGLAVGLIEEARELSNSFLFFSMSFLCSSVISPRILLEL